MRLRHYTLFILHYTLVLCALSAQSTPDLLIPGNGFEPFGPPQTRWPEHMPSKLPDGRLVSITLGLSADNGGEIITSTDGGKTWPAKGNIPVFNRAKLPPEFKGNIPALVNLTVTSSGAWIALAYSPVTPAWPGNKKAWDSAKGDFHKNFAGWHLYSTRSTDQGKTWSPLTRIFAPDPSSSHVPRIILEVAPGILVIPAQHTVRNPGRNAITMLRSTDDGQTWQNTGYTFDFPNSRGDHDGLFEPTMIQLRDPAKTTWILIRTNLGVFFESRSTDQGKTWSSLVPTNLQTSSAPGTLFRLSDGRIVLAWNPQKASDGVPPQIVDASMENGRYHAIPASWDRRELLLATSRDEGKTWSKPLLIARYPHGAGSRHHERIHYTGLWEFDGYLHLGASAGQGTLQARIPINKLP